MESAVKTENRLAKMEQKIDNLIDSVDKIDKKLDKHIDLEDEKYEKMDSKYSGKWVETAIIAIATSLTIAAIVGIATYFMK